MATWPTGPQGATTLVGTLRLPRLRAAICQPVAWWRSTEAGDDGRHQCCAGILLVDLSVGYGQWDFQGPPIMDPIKGSHYWGYMKIPLIWAPMTRNNFLIVMHINIIDMKVTWSLRGFRLRNPFNELKPGCVMWLLKTRAFYSFDHGLSSLSIPEAAGMWVEKDTRKTWVEVMEFNFSPFEMLSGRMPFSWSSRDFATPPFRWHFLKATCFPKESTTSVENGWEESVPVTTFYIQKGLKHVEKENEEKIPRNSIKYTPED